MARPRTPVGTFGAISFERKPNGRVQASARYRDEDGVLRRVRATAGSERSAERDLKVLLAKRVHVASAGELTADSSFSQLVEVWLADLDLEGRLASSTRVLYERNMRQLVQPAFEGLRLREISVSRVDRFLKAQRVKSYSTAKQSKVVLGLALGLAVRYDAMPRNPVRETARLHRPPSRAKALTVTDVQAIRAAVAAWRRDPGLPGPPPDGQIEAIIEVMLGTSARIGEVLAIRRCDVDLSVDPATVRLCGTVVSPKGTPTHRQDHPKTSTSVRTVAVPTFTAAMLRERLAALGEGPGEDLVFCTRNRTPLTTNNVRRRLRAILEAAGLDAVTPHAFRRTVATVIDRAAGAELAASMLGHSSPDITRAHYIEPDAQVDPVTAAILETLAPGTSRRPDAADEAGEADPWDSGQQPDPW